MPVLPTERGRRTHGAIVQEAARLFRERGVGATAVHEVMRAAGLTHGGFYAHFRDKRAMLVEALDATFDEARRRLFSREERGRPWLERVTHLYLRDEHLADPGRGCAIAALGEEVARQDPALRRRFERNLRTVLAGVAERMPGREESRRRRGIAAFALWVGGVMIARAVDDPKLSAEILAACKEHLLGPVPDGDDRSLSASARR